MLLKQVQFTFKYPKKLTDTDKRFVAIKDKINKIDDAIQNDLEHIDEYIDFDSHINWLLAHELLGTADGSGSNMFFYQYDMSPISKLKMGPLWDFDSTLSMVTNRHSSFWYYESTYLPFLLKSPKFIYS